MIDLIGWIATATLLGTYAIKIKYFDYANMILAIPVALPALYHGAYSAGAVSLTFGVIATIKIVRRR